MTAIAGRYRIQAELGRGGMGAVYRVLDEGMARVVALKLLTRTDARARELFRREFQTLAKIAHPRVIHVYEYGTTQDGADYYTMELLSGRDLHATVPLAWRNVCEVMRDVCTSLALLHAQRLVHRDVNPRNVHIDAGGGAKLLDFGALAPFGVASEIVGAPSCMAPETLDGRAIDGRADLFALGVIAYWSLTQRLPYAIDSIDTARAAWGRAPLAPSAYVAGVPAALDELILALLRVDPLARPGSAAEVIDRVGAIAALEDEPLASIAESHVRSATLVGRDDVVAKLEQVLSATRERRGSALSVVSEAGGGKSRILRELATRAQLRGFVSVAIACRECADAEQLLSELTAQLERHAPHETRSATAYQTCRTLQLAATPDNDSSLELGLDADEHERRRLFRRQAMLARLYAEVAERVPLSICLDDVDALSERASVVLPLLAQAALDRPLLVAASRMHGAAAPGVAQLALVGSVVTLEALDDAAIDRLVVEMFGDVPNATRLSHWLTLVARGNPRRSSAALLSLLQRRTVRYAGGTWHLPSDLSTQELPLEAIAFSRSELAALSTSAQASLRALAVHGGPLGVDMCAQLVPDAEAALAELEQQRLIVRVPQGVTFSQTGTRDGVLASLSESERRALHERLALALIARYASSLRAIEAAKTSSLELEHLLSGLAVGRHLLLSGDEDRATPLLRNAAVELTVRGEGLTAAVPLVQEAVELYRARGRSRRIYSGMMTVLALAGTYTDWRLSYRYGEEMLEMLVEVSGLSLARRLARVLGGTLALYLGLAVGFVLFTLVPARRITDKFRTVLLGVMGLGTGTISVATVTQDPERATRLVALLGPLRHFPRTHAVRAIHEYQMALVDHAQGRYAEARGRAMATLLYLRSERARDALPERARVQLELGVLIMLGPLDATRSDGAALETLAQIERVHSSTSRQTYAAARMAYHGHRGERESYLAWRERTDRLAAEEGSTWRNDVQTPRMLWSTHVLCGDVLTLKRDLEQVAELAVHIPTLGRLRDLLHASYWCERGMAREALARHEAVFCAALDHSGARAVQQLGIYARLLRNAGRTEDALQVCERASAKIGEGDQPFTLLLFPVRLELTLALVQRGDLERARPALAALLEAQRAHDNPMLHALAHAASAELAIAERDAAQVELHLSAMREWLREAQHPTLVAQAHRLGERARLALQPPTSNEHASAADAEFETELVDEDA